jgi:peroxiredoxin
MAPMKAKIVVGLGAALLASIAIAGIAAVASMTLARPAPEVKFSALSGETFTTSELRGKVVLVTFWATYCGPCIQEMPKMVDAHLKFSARGYETVAVAVKGDDPARVAHFKASHALPFKVALDSSGELAREFGNVRITPTGFLIDKNGKVLRRYVAEPDWAELHQLVERELRS